MASVFIQPNNVFPATANILWVHSWFNQQTLLSRHNILVLEENDFLPFYSKCCTLSSILHKIFALFWYVYICMYLYSICIQTPVCISLTVCSLCTRAKQQQVKNQKIKVASSRLLLLLFSLGSSPSQQVSYTQAEPYSQLGKLHCWWQLSHGLHLLKDFCLPVTGLSCCRTNLKNVFRTSYKMMARILPQINFCL